MPVIVDVTASAETRTSTESETMTKTDTEGETALMMKVNRKKILEQRQSLKQQQTQS